MGGLAPECAVEQASKWVMDEELRALIADMYSGSSEHGNLHDVQSTESMIQGGARQIEALLHRNASTQSRSPQVACLQVSDELWLHWHLTVFSTACMHQPVSLSMCLPCGCHCTQVSC